MRRSSSQSCPSLLLPAGLVWYSRTVPTSGILWMSPSVQVGSLGTCPVDALCGTAEYRSENGNFLIFLFQAVSKFFLLEQIYNVQDSQYFFFYVNASKLQLQLTLIHLRVQIAQSVEYSIYIISCYEFFI